MEGGFTTRKNGDLRPPLRGEPLEIWLRFVGESRGVGGCYRCDIDVGLLLVGHHVHNRRVYNDLLNYPPLEGLIVGNVWSIRRRRASKLFM